MKKFSDLLFLRHKCRRYRNAPDGGWFGSSSSSPERDLQLLPPLVEACSLWRGREEGGRVGLGARAREKRARRKEKRVAGRKMLICTKTSSDVASHHIDIASFSGLLLEAEKAWNEAT